jgi:serine/threonine-protein kinase
MPEVLSADDEARAKARAAREALVGKNVASRYVLRGLVGHGGMGAVYEAEQLGLGKRVAIKFVDPEFATDEQVVSRFAREARAMSTIESAHIVTILDAGTEDGRPYLVMELLRGEDLGQRLRRTRTVPIGEAMHVVAQVLKGLARAHRAGIVHRDLKPDNVFLTKTDTDPLFAKIVDFGISKIDRPRASTTPMTLTGRGTIIGTPLYMSPEQAQCAAEVDGRADLYSVGAILFECLSGRPPHVGETYEQVILSIVMREAPDIRTIEKSIPDDVAAFLARALARDRDQRFASAERMLAALHEIAPAERLRVPLDPLPAMTLVSEGAQTDVMEAVKLPEDEKPSSATKVGVALLDSRGKLQATHLPADEPITRPESPGARDSASRANGVPVVAAAPRASDPAWTQGKRESRTSAATPAKKTGAILVTAVLATLTGVGAMFAIIFALGKKEEAPAGPTTPASAAVVVSSPAPPSLSPIPSETASAPPAASSVSHVAPKPTTLPALPPSSSKTAPKPSGAPTKPLDINRDLP